MIFGEEAIGNSGFFPLVSIDGKNGFKLNGSYSGPEPCYASGFGRSIGSADVNNDGINDIIIGDRPPNFDTGAAYIVFGGKSLTNCSLPTFPPTTTSLPTPAPTPIPTPTPTPTPAPTLPPTPSPTFTPTPTSTPVPTAMPSQSNSVSLYLIIGASGISLLALLCCLYKYRHKQHKNNFSDHKSIKLDYTTQRWPESTEVVAETEDFAGATQFLSSKESYQSLPPSEPIALTISTPTKSKATASSPLASPLISPVGEYKLSLRRKSSLISDSGEIKISFAIKFSELQFDKKQDKLGKGSFGTVYKGTYNYNNVAIKKLHLTFDQTALVTFKQEMTIMAKIRSNYVVSLMGVCLDAPNYCIVMELMSRGSLYNFLQDPSPLSLERIYGIAMRIALGLYHLHQQEIIHGDLKSLNVLLDDQNVKVADFGLSKIKTDTDSSSSGQKVSGTLAWMAPELFDEKARPTKQADIYALGVVLYELINKPYVTPFKGLAINALIAAKTTRGVNQLTIPSNCPPEYAKLIHSCWTNPQQRPDAKNLADNLFALFTKTQSQSVVKSLLRSSSTLSEIPSYTSNPLCST